MKKLLCMLAVSSLLFASCSSSDDSSSTVNADDVLVMKTIYTYASGGPAVTVNHTYNGHKAVRSEDSEGNYETYTYTGDLITQIKNYSPDDDLEQTETFTYNGSNQLTSYVRAEIMDDIGYKETYVYNGDGTVSVTSYSGTATTQTDPEGTGTVLISNGEVSIFDSPAGMHSYTYDNKNNPFKNVTGFDKIMFVDGESTGGINHNILTDTYTSFETTVYTSVYTYNSMNFPTTVAETEGTDSTSTITTQFIYN